MAFYLKNIPAEDTYPIRHKVLWPDLPLEKCILKQDDIAHHFGAFQKDTLVGVLSLFPDDKLSMRLRKFAIVPQFQGQGIGLFMLQEVIKKMVDTQIESIWCDARTSALGFYEKVGFIAEGEQFFKRHVPYNKMICPIK